MSTARSELTRMVFTHAEVQALQDYANGQSKARTFEIVLAHNVKYVVNANSTRHRLTPERLG